jgi:hypothetical protein
MRIVLRAARLTFAIASASFFAACGPRLVLRPELSGHPNPPASWRASVPLLFVADLQHHVAYGEIELPPLFREMGINQGHLEKRASGFYRHAARGLLAPDALDWLLRDARARGLRYGVLAGDLADLGCVAEADAVFEVLGRHQDMKMMIALGNHDISPIGTLSPSAALDEWTRACERHGGVLSKPAMIGRVLDYYAAVWGLDAGARGPGTQARTLSRTIAGDSVTLRLEARVDPAAIPCVRKDACAHRHTWLYQRFELAAREGARSTITIPDTVDYADAELLAPTLTARLVGLGQTGGVSRAQVAWLRALPTPRGHHVIATHYAPFENIEQSPKRMCGAPTSAPGRRDGARCVQSDFGANFVTRGAAQSGLHDWIFAHGADTLLAYAHSHEPMLAGFVRERRRGGRRVATLRIPSLIDNAGAVSLVGGVARTLSLPQSLDVRLADSDASYWTPLYRFGQLCQARARDYADLARNVHRFTGRRCPSGDLDRFDAEGEALCRDVRFERGRGEHGHIEAWIRGNPDRWATLRATACRGAAPHAAWRCVLRARTQALLETCVPDAKQRGALGAHVLAAPGKATDAAR